MAFCELNALFFVFAIAAQRLVESDATLSIDDGADETLKQLLTDFLTDLEKHTLAYLDYCHAVVLGKNEIFLDSTRSLLEKKPHYIGNRPDATVAASDLTEASLTLVHVDDLSDSDLNLILARSQSYSSRKVLLVSTGRKSGAIASTGVKMNVKSAAFASVDRNSQVINIYRRRFSGKCGHDLAVFNTWVWGKGFLKRRRIFLDANAPVDLHGCPVTIGTFDMPPSMNLRKNEDGSAEMVDGVEADLIRAIAQRLNFVPIVRRPAMDEQWWLASNGTGYGIVEDVARGRAVLGIGKIRPTVGRKQRVDMTMPYNWECLVWTVPLTLRYNRSIVVSEFSPKTWALVITAFALACGMAFLIQKMETGKWRGSWGVLDVLSVSIGNPIPHKPLGRCGKILFVVYLNYSRVIITAYSSSLASILSTTSLEPTIRDEQGIFDAGLPIAGSQSLLDLLDETFFLDHKEIHLRDGYQVIRSLPEAIARFEADDDIAFIRHYSSINYIIAQLLKTKKPVKFRPLDGCVISYYSVIVTSKGSQLAHSLSEIVVRLVESGITAHWTKTDDRVDDTIKKYDFNVGGLFVLKFIFLFYASCVMVSSLSFLVELLIFKLRKPSSALN